MVGGRGGSGRVRLLRLEVGEVGEEFRVLELDVEEVGGCLGGGWYWCCHDEYVDDS